MILLAIDTTLVITTSITGFVSLASLVITLLLKGNVKELKKEVDGKMSQLLDAKKNEGILQEMEHSKIATAELNVKLVEAVKQIQPDTKPTDTPAEVKVVNKEPIDVKPTEPLTFSKPAAPNDDSLK